MDAPQAESSRFCRLPGRFSRWEIPDVLVAGIEYRLEYAGHDCHGTPLFEIYKRVKLESHETAGPSPTAMEPVDPQ